MFKRLFCKHEYKFVNEVKDDGRPFAFFDKKMETSMYKMRKNKMDYK